MVDLMNQSMYAAIEDLTTAYRDLGEARDNFQDDPSSLSEKDEQTIFAAQYSTGIDDPEDALLQMKIDVAETEQALQDVTELAVGSCKNPGAVACTEIGSERITFTENFFDGYDENSNESWLSIHEGAHIIGFDDEGYRYNAYKFHCGVMLIVNKRGC
jgi:hypothetical protein